MSNSVFQNVILQLRDVSDRTFGVMDTDGCVVSCTDVSLLGERWPDAALKAANAGENLVAFGQKTFKGIVNNIGNVEYTVFCTGDDDMARALDFYDRFEHASPEIQEAITALLKKKS